MFKFDQISYHPTKKFIKVNKRVYRHTIVPVGDDLLYTDFINNKLQNFVSRIIDIINNTELDSVRKTMFRNWTNITLCPITEIGNENILESIITSFTHDLFIDLKLKKLYLDIAVEVPEEILENRKYNFYMTLLKTFNVDLGIIDYIDKNIPYIFIVSILSEIWWTAIKETDMFKNLQDDNFLK